MGGVGAILREARIERGVELTEVEAATKIRGRFLAAIEKEDWDVLPGRAYAAGFVRAYADHLGLDGARMAAECPSRPEPPAPGEGQRRGRSRRVVVAAVGLLWTAGDDDGEGPASTPERGAPAAAPAERASEGDDAGGAMELSLTTRAELWVCLLGADGRPLVNGIVLPAGAEEGPFRSGSFTVSFGNGKVEMRIDGRDTDIPESPGPLGYEVGPGGDLSELSESARPTCT